MLFLPCCALSFEPSLLRLCLSLGDRDLVGGPWVVSPPLSPPVTGCTRQGGCKTQLLQLLLCSCGEETMTKPGQQGGAACPQSHHVKQLLFGGKKKAFGKGDGILLGLNSTVWRGWRLPALN